MLAGLWTRGLKTSLSAPILLFYSKFLYFARLVTDIPVIVSSSILFLSFFLLTVFEESMLTHSSEGWPALVAVVDYSLDSYLVREDSYEDYISYYIFLLIDLLDLL